MRRHRWVITLAAVVVVAFVVRLAYVQVYKGPALAAEAQAERMASSTTPAHRGDITDSNGVVLATSVDRYTVAADQQQVATFKPRANDVVDGVKLTEAGPVGVAKLLAPLLGIPAPQLAATMTGTSRYKVLKRDVLPEVQRAIIDLNLAAYISTEQTSMRIYPAQTVAGNLVGLVTLDDKGNQVGAGGIESVYNDVLAGTPGSVVYERGRKGQQIPTGERKQVTAVPGDNVRLTIDRDVQRKTQDAIDAAVASTGADYGIVVVQSVKTAALLALADSGTPNPNDRGATGVGAASRAVANIFEPGSTGKVVTMAAALETGVATPASQFTVPYYYRTPNGQTFHDSHEHGTLKLTLAGILAQSSNTGTVQVGQRIPKQVEYDYLKKFGFGQHTGLGLPGESAGIVHPVDQWDGRTRYTVFFGQGVAVNAVQATSVFSTIANGGVRLTPNLVAGTSTPDGVFTPAAPSKQTQVISPQAAQTLLTMMESVVESGSGVKAAVPGYRIAGKTGTAQAQDAKGGMNDVMASFIGVAPADAPQYTVSVFLKNPKTSIYGGDVAAPVFSDVMAYVLEHEGVPPSSEDYVPLPLTW